MFKDIEWTPLNAEEIATLQEHRNMKEQPPIEMKFAVEKLSPKPGDLVVFRLEGVPDDCSRASEWAEKSFPGVKFVFLPLESEVDVRCHVCHESIPKEGNVVHPWFATMAAAERYGFNPLACTFGGQRGFRCTQYGKTYAYRWNDDEQMFRKIDRGDICLSDEEMRDGNPKPSGGYAYWNPDPAITVNELRALRGLPPLDGLDLEGLKIEPINCSPSEMDYQFTAAEARAVDAVLRAQGISKEMVGEPSAANYANMHSNAVVPHGICPSCSRRTITTQLLSRTVYDCPACGWRSE